MQRSDSPARQVPGYWLGDPSAGLRWPFDWTFAAWRVWAMLTVALAPLLVLAVPAAGLLALFAWRFAGRARPHVPQVRSRKGVNHTALVVGLLVAALALLVFPTPAWLFPLPWPLALLCAPLVGAWATKKLRPFFDDPNTPVSYWRALLPRIASGPRARREPAVLVSATERREPDRPLHDLEYAALTIDPREVIVKTAKPKTPTLEFDQWLPADMRKGAETLAWLSSHGCATEVREGNVLLITRGKLKVTTRVPPGDVIVRMTDGQFHSMREHAFKAEYDVIA